MAFNTRRRAVVIAVQASESSPAQRSASSGGAALRLRAPSRAGGLQTSFAIGKWTGPDDACTTESRWRCHRRGRRRRAARTDRASLFTIGLFSNPLLLWGILFELVFTAAVIYAPPLQHIFGTASLSWTHLAIIAPFPIIVWGVETNSPAG